MIQYRRLAIGIAALAIVSAGTAVWAHQGGMGRMEGMQDMHGKMEGMHGKMGGRHGGGADHEAIHQLVTPQEREAMREKMKAAKTPEERQALRAGMRAEIEKRAKEKGITLPERHARMGGKHGMGHGGRGHGEGAHKH